MSQPYLAEIKILSFNFPPKGWALCNGQLLAINQNQALFSILGTTYGGDGRVNFALPNLQGRVPVHTGQGVVLGERTGEASHTLIPSEMPAHVHPPVGSTAAASLKPATGNLWATDSTNLPFAATANGSMNPACVLPIGGNQPHDNMPPYLVLNYVIALAGIFPSQN